MSALLSSYNAISKSSKSRSKSSSYFYITYGRGFVGGPTIMPFGFILYSSILFI